MTKLTKKVVRETEGRFGERPIVVELDQKVLRMRLKGSREAPLPVRYEDVYLFAARSKHVPS